MNGRSTGRRISGFSSTWWSRRWSDGTFARSELKSLLFGFSRRRLIEAEIPYLRQKGVTLGTVSLLLLDPAGNWLELTEVRAIH